MTSSPCNEHMKEVCYEYFEHFKKAGLVSARLLLGAACALVHAIAPAFSKKSTESLVKDLSAEFEKKNKALTIYFILKNK